MPNRQLWSSPFEDDWWREDEEEAYWRERTRSPSFRELHPNFDSGAQHPDLIYPINCPDGDQCKGHPRSEGVYSEEYLWAYTRTPKINFLGQSNVVPVREEFL